MRRDRQPELMDDPALSSEHHAAALRGLARINRVSGSGPILWPELQKLIKNHLIANEPVRILDIATGGGDLPRWLARRCRRAGIPADILGMDKSSSAIDYAREETSAARLQDSVRYMVADVFTDPWPEGFDIVICSLFLHHLDESESVQLLDLTRRHARRLVLINDLDRNWLSYSMVWVACHALSRSHVVHSDGPLSVKAAWTPGEILGFAKSAGMVGPIVQRRFPARWLLSWRRES